MFKYIKETVADLRTFLAENKPNYQQQLEWSNPNEPVFLTWNIKVIAQHWKDVGIPAIIIVILSLCGGVYGFLQPDKLTFWTAQAIMLPIISGIFLLDFCVKTQFIYRITESGIEYHSWHVYPEFLFTAIKVTFGILCVVILLVGISSGSGLLALAGPVSLAIMAGLPALRKGFKKDSLNKQHRGADWDEIKRFQYDAKKRLLRFDYEFEVSDEEKKKAMQALIDLGYRASEPIIDGECDIFLIKENEQQALSLIQHNLPNLTLELTKLRLPDNP